MEKFKQLGLSEGIINVAKTKGFSEPSEIQEKTIPLVIEGKDVIGCSATGSGKTFAFGAGIIDKMQSNKGIQTLIMTPTRELAEQVSQTLKIFSAFKKLKICEIYGGVSMGPQISHAKYADIVVGTPGRLLDHIENKTLNLSHVKYLVLDEADRMLDMGFIKDVEKIISYTPKERQTLLFSATISSEIKGISSRYMKNPVFISVNNQVDPSKLHQKYYNVSTEDKFSLLLYLLRQEKNGVSMIFCNTRKNVDRLASALFQHGVKSLPIHGGLSQNQRNNTLQAFHDRRTNILICTDVAARGLDIKDVTHIYNFDLPEIPSDYIHRIGRTARAGKNGIAISFVSKGDYIEFNQILKEIKINIEEDILPKMTHVNISFGSNEDRREGRRQNMQNRNRGRFRGRRFTHSNFSRGDRDNDRRDGNNTRFHRKRRFGRNLNSSSRFSHNRLRRFGRR